jgi:hypothetical protein
LTTAQVAALTTAQVSTLTTGQLNAMTTTQFAAFTLTQVGALRGQIATASDSLIKAWTRQFGTDSYDSAHSMATGTDGSVYIIGYSRGNLDDQLNSGQGVEFITKYFSDGSKAWTKLL